ncbi:MAG: N-acetylmuramoyl-L-alanine amidase [bacterium]|nr:MAG: N-acetylmuramoyl-L-alanine amidase [bacterium]
MFLLILRTSVLLLILFVFPHVSIAEQGKVTLRYSLQNEMVRIVLQSEKKEMIRKTRVHSSYSLVRVEFPDDFKLSAPRVTGGFEYTKREKTLFLNIKGLKWIKLLRLKSPPRLVIDAYLKSGIDTKPPDRKIPPEIKDLSPVLPVPEDKTEGTIKKLISTIVLDPGHGGYDLGIYTRSYSEKSIDLKVSKSLRYKLRKKRKKVFLTRRDDRYKSLMARILYARKKSPDLILSLHMSSSNHVAIYTSPPKQLHGEERYLLSNSQTVHVDTSRLIARKIGSTMMQDLNISVFFRELDIPILSYANSPAILIELPNAEFFDYSGKNIELLVNSIMEGLLAYEKG